MKLKFSGRLILPFFIAILATGCSKDDDNANPSDSCRPTKITFPNGDANNFTYNSNGRLEKVKEIMPNGEEDITIELTYDAADRVNQIRHFYEPTGHTEIAYQYTYNGSGQLIKQQQINYIGGTTTPGNYRTFEYNNNGQVSRANTFTKYAGSDSLESYSTFTYDSNGTLNTQSYFSKRPVGSGQQLPEMELVATANYVFDNKKGPFRALNLPPLSLDDIEYSGAPSFYLAHNLLQKSLSDKNGNSLPQYSATIEYTYSAQGYPLTQTSNNQTLSLSYQCN